MNNEDWDNPSFGTAGAAEALLDYAERQVARAEKVSRGLASSHGPAASFPGYTTVRRIKAGGQGVVYEAVHQSTKRTVAIKVAPDSMRDDAPSRERFAREVEVLSQLRHPNIVRITDGGEVAGRLYLVTDYIPGEPLDVYLAGRDLSTADVLALFATICDAVNAAHLRSVVHRDLKPSNILVDEHGQPHILDFGLAKLIAPDSAMSQAPHGVTITGQFVGSLPWATPEQIRGDPGAIDVRTDVYAIGVMLYRALTGQHPYEVDGPTHDVLGNILHAPPERPSSIDGGPDGEIETILLKCLSKEPDRRYQSAGALALDIRRYLRGEPIAARPDSTWYVLSKMVGRHRVVTAVAGALLLVLVGWALTASVLYGRAKSAERDARQDYVRARDVLAESLAISIDLARLSGASKARRQLLMTAHDKLYDMAADGTYDPVIQSLMADVAVGLGDITLSSAALDEAEDQFRSGLAIYEELVESDPNNPKWQMKLSIASVRAGDAAKQRGDDTTARERYEYALAIDEGLAERYPDDAHVLSNLLWSYERMGWLEQRTGHWTDAAHFFAKQRELVAEQLAEADPDNSARLVELRSVYGQQADLAERTEDHQHALAFARDGLAISRRLLALEPDNSEYLQKTVSACLAVEQTTPPVDSINIREKGLLRSEALSMAQRLMDDEPKDVLNQSLLARWYGSMALAAADSGDHEAAYTHQRRCLSLRESVAESEPDSPKAAHLLFDALTETARFASHTRHHGDTREITERAMALAEEIIANHVADADLLSTYARILLRSKWSSTGDRARAIEVLAMATEKLDYADPRAVLPLCKLLRDTGRLAQASEILKGVLALPHIRDTPAGLRLVELYEDIRPGPAAMSD